MNVNQTKKRLQDGRTVYGVISSSTDPQIAEILAFCGFDYYLLDTEHGAINPADAVHIIRACEARNITPLVRIGQKDAKVVLPYLDAGMQGVMMPGLETVAEIEMLVTAVKYAPLGKRGLGPARAANYMLGSGTEQADYVSQANEQTLVLPQFEDPNLLDVLPAMAQVSGVDGFVFGPRDLALAMGHPDGPNYPDVQNMLRQATDLILAAGLFVGTTAGSYATAQTEQQRGARFILTSLPALLQQGSQLFLTGSAR